jgi:hypothetical protein
MRRALPAKIVEAAQRQVGYHAQPEKRSAFSPRTYEGTEWNGSFVNRILTDAFGTAPEVSFQSTVAALAYYTTRNRLYRKPRVGDIVFFNFSADPGEWDRQPHVGVVTELRADGSFRTVEGQTFSGKPQGIQLADGVHERVRYGTDVLGFVRPRPARKVTAGETVTVRMSYFDSNGKTVARAVETVQTALGTVRPEWMPTGRGKDGLFNRGKRDGVFKSAFGAFARETGEVRNRGEITYPALQNLEETGLRVEP